jgi:hypothetical protein
MAYLYFQPFLFGWLAADGWCWFALREEYCWLVADKPSEQGACQFLSPLLYCFALFSFIALCLQSCTFVYGLSLLFPPVLLFNQRVVWFLSSHMFTPLLLLLLEDLPYLVDLKHLGSMIPLNTNQLF